MLKSKIKSQYENHSCERITQGDILRDVNILIVDGEGQLEVIELQYQYGVVLSQDCDLQQGCKISNNQTDSSNPVAEFNQFLPSILFVPAFPAEIFRLGEHLIGLYKIKAQKINTDEWKRLKKNNNSRYHYLPADQQNQVPDLVLDFKTYFTIPYKTLSNEHKNHYLTTVNEIFREELSQRFANYLSRIGLPELSNR